MRCVAIRGFMDVDRHVRKLHACRVQSQTCTDYPKVVFQGIGIQFGRPKTGEWESDMCTRVVSKSPLLAKIDKHILLEHTRNQRREEPIRNPGPSRAIPCGAEQFDCPRRHSTRGSSTSACIYMLIVLISSIHTKHVSSVVRRVPISVGAIVLKRMKMQLP